MKNTKTENQNNNLVLDFKEIDKLNNIVNDDLSSENDYMNSSLDSILPLKDINLQNSQNLKIHNKKKKFLFIVVRKKMDNDSFGLFDLQNSFSSNHLRKKRGRKSKSEKNRYITKYEHTPFKNDNKMRKIQSGYITFLIKLINEIMDTKLHLNYSFIELDYRYKGNINKDFRIKLNNKKIKDIIIEAPISPKFSSKEENYNVNIYKRLVLKGKNIVLDILEKKFLFFFEIYYKNEKKINLSTFGFEPLEIELSHKIKMFKDLEINNIVNNLIDYKREIDNCAKKYFLNESKVLKKNEI